MQSIFVQQFFVKASEIPSIEKLLGLHTSLVTVSLSFLSVKRFHISCPGCNPALSNGAVTLSRRILQTVDIDRNLIHHPFSQWPRLTKSFYRLVLLHLLLIQDVRSSMPSQRTRSKSTAFHQERIKQSLSKYNPASRYGRSTWNPIVSEDPCRVLLQRRALQAVQKHDMCHQSARYARNFMPLPQAVRILHASRCPRSVRKYVINSTVLI